MTGVQTCALPICTSLKKQSIFMERTFIQNLRFRDVHAEFTGQKRPEYEGHLLSRDLHLSDFVLIEYNDSGDSRILRTLPRRSYFTRLDPSSGRHGEQAVAANFDYVFIIQSLNKDYNIRKLERYLTESWQSGAEPVVVLTKADLTEEVSEYERRTVETVPGVRIVAVSARTGYGMEELEGYLKPGKTIVLLGSSGVGKSSLVNALAKEDRKSVV